MNKQPENYESDLLSGLLSEITPEEQEKTNNRMLLAARIDKAREKKGWSRKEFKGTYMHPAILPIVNPASFNTKK